MSTLDFWILRSSFQKKKMSGFAPYAQFKANGFRMRPSRTIILLKYYARTHTGYNARCRVAFGQFGSNYCSITGVIRRRDRERADVDVARRGRYRRNGQVTKSPNTTRGTRRDLRLISRTCRLSPIADRRVERNRVRIQNIRTLMNRTKHVNMWRFMVIALYVVITVSQRLRQRVCLSCGGRYGEAAVCLRTSRYRSTPVFVVGYFNVPGFKHVKLVFSISFWVVYFFLPLSQNTNDSKFSRKMFRFHPALTLKQWNDENLFFNPLL